MSPIFRSVSGSWSLNYEIVDADPIFRSVSGFGSLEHGIVNAEVIGDGCLRAPDTHTEPPDDFCNLLVFVCGDFGLEGGSKQGAGGPHF